MSRSYLTYHLSVLYLPYQLETLKLVSVCVMATGARQIDLQSLIHMCVCRPLGYIAYREISQIQWFQRKENVHIRIISCFIPPEKQSGQWTGRVSPLIISRPLCLNRL